MYKINVKSDAIVVSVEKESNRKYKVKTKVSPYYYVSYEGYDTEPKIGGKKVVVGMRVKVGQTITG